jgi:hypothetical protein
LLETILSLAVALYLKDNYATSLSIRLNASNRIHSLANGIAFPKTSPNSYRLFRAAPSRLRMQWVCPSAVPDIVSGITLLCGGTR